MSDSGVCAPGRSSMHLIGDQMQLSTLRLNAKAMGRTHGLDADAVERLGVVVTEMARNIARHAETGRVILRPVGDHTTGCIEVLALDKGPGIADMSRAMRDPGSISGESRAYSGLVDLKRLAELFDIYSHPGVGTCVVAQVGSQPRYDVGVVCVPLHGEEACGDAWAVESVPGRLTAMLVDGLGHGPEAATAAQAAMAVFRDVAVASPDAILDAMHNALRRTRGAALSVTVVDQIQRTATFCGVGNVDGRVVTTDMNRHLIPQNGIVGHTMPRAASAEVPWPRNARLVMHSDGISSRWQSEKYPGLLARHPTLFAGVLFRDGARARDDATVLVVRDAIVVEAT